MQIVVYQMFTLFFCILFGRPSLDLCMYLHILMSKACVIPDGNGFKTSTMRLGADVIVFSRATRTRYFP